MKKPKIPRKGGEASGDDPFQYSPDCLREDNDAEGGGEIVRRLTGFVEDDTIGLLHGGRVVPIS